MERGEKLMVDEIVAVPGGLSERSIDVHTSWWIKEREVLRDERRPKLATGIVAVALDVVPDRRVDVQLVSTIHRELREHRRCRGVHVKIRRTRGFQRDHDVCIDEELHRTLILRDSVVQASISFDAVWMFGIAV
jgi:hypothetical protein